MMKEITVLIANDKKTDLLIIESCLSGSETPIEVIKALNGEEAYELAQTEKPDLIVMDWDMPVLDGISAIKQLKSSSNTSEIPVIMLTAVNRSSDNLKTALSAGAIDFVRYPIDEIEFLARVKSVLRMNQYYREKVKAENEAKKLLKAQVDLKNRELAALTLNSLYKKNLILKLKKKLSSISQKCPEANEILFVLNYFDENEEDWNIFRDYFEAVHNGFFDRLSAVHSELTPNEKRLCAYLRIGLNSNEISKLLSISKEGIKKNRYLLRKKMGLQTGESLEDFISKI
jgi:DNA-binding response OmpR family regulator/DNA-binding CsgD family transcriptional regulator